MKAAGSAQSHRTPLATRRPRVMRRCHPLPSLLAGMVLGSTCVGVHMAATQGVLFGMLASCEGLAGQGGAGVCGRVEMGVRECVRVVVVVVRNVRVCVCGGGMLCRCARRPAGVVCGVPHCQ
jgi:hypothetical protein